MSFEQAVIKIEKEKEFDELKAAISRAFSPVKVKKFLTRLSGRNVRVRDWEAVLVKRILEQLDDGLANSGKTAQDIYQSLTVSDQAQLREFYLFRVEEVEPGVRAKFQKIYRYY